jgi:quinol monooxygenase YgiN
MAIGVTATLKVQDGMESDFEAVFRDLAAKVRANEPGNGLYQLFKSRKDKGTYIVMEVYQDQAALEAHGKSNHCRSAQPVLGGRPDVQFFDSI